MACNLSINGLFFYFLSSSLYLFLHYISTAIKSNAHCDEKGRWPDKLCRRIFNLGMIWFDQPGMILTWQLPMTHHNGNILIHVWQTLQVNIQPGYYIIDQPGNCWMLISIWLGWQSRWNIRFNILHGITNLT